MTVPIQIQRLPRRRKPALTQRAFLWALWALILAALAGIGYGAHGMTPAALERPESVRPAAAARACPPGHAVEWLSSTEMTCLKEISP